MMNKDSTPQRTAAAQANDAYGLNNNNQQANEEEKRPESRAS